jgi:hypothetical protein
MIASAPASLTDVMASTTVSSNAGEYLSDLDGSLQARLRWIPITDLEAADGWTIMIDTVNFTINN